MTAIETLVAALFLWIASNTSFTVPEIDQTDLVKIASNEIVNDLYYGDLIDPEGMGDVITFYDSMQNTLFISASYDVESPFHRTLLFQEVVFIVEEAAMDAHPHLHGEAINLERDRLFKLWFDKQIPVIVSSR